MTNRIDRGIQLRAQEILMNSQDPMSTIAAVKLALIERYGDDIEALREVAAIAATGTLNTLRKSSYNLPEESGQLALYDIPSVIVVSTEDGDLVVPKQQASTGHVRQWQREGQQHHSVQLTRFKRLGKDLKIVDDQDDTIPWEDQTLPTLAERKQKQLEAGE